MRHVWGLVAGVVLMLVAAAPVGADPPWNADAALVAKLSASNNAFNYDESRVPEYKLPDPLLSASGTLVADAASWPRRREETMELFRSHVYGHRPTTAYSVAFEVTAEKHSVFDLNAMARSVTVTIQSGAETFRFPMLVFLPPKVARTNDSPAGLSPAVIHINNREFPTLDIAIAEKNEFWPVYDIVKRGYVACAVSTSAIDPDRADGFAEGLRGFFWRADGDKTTIPSEDAWKALSAWGWGASRALDYLLTLDQVDKSKVALIGHSRGGKACFGRLQKILDLPLFAATIPVVAVRHCRVALMEKPSPESQPASRIGSVTGSRLTREKSQACQSISTNCWR